MPSITETARQCYEAFAAGDRDTVERLMAPDLAFTSPLDNRIDRDAYFKRCWPNSALITAFEIIRTAAEGDRVFVVYEATGTDGRRFRNAEVLRVENGRIHEVEVYFGWNIPHEAPPGGFVDDGVAEA